MSRLIVPALCWLSSSFGGVSALVRLQYHHHTGSIAASTSATADSESVGGVVLRRRQQRVVDPVVAEGPESEVLQRKPFKFPLDIGTRRFLAAAEMTISLPWPYPLLRAYNVALYVDVKSNLWRRSNGLNEMLSEMPGDVSLVYNLTSAFLDNQRFAAACPPMATFMPNVSWAAEALGNLQSRYENGPKFQEGSVIILNLGKDGAHMWMDGVDAGMVEAPGPELSQAIIESTFQIPQFQTACYWNLLAGQPAEVSAPVPAEVHVSVPWYAVVFPTFAVIVSLWCFWRRCMGCLSVCFSGMKRR